MNRFPGLDGLRAVSILAVIGAHIQRGNEGPITSTFGGAWGVSLFFVISGFLITTLLLKERARTGSVCLSGFYLRRALRIFPVAYLYLGTIALLAALGVVQLGQGDLLGAALYVNNLVPTSDAGWLVGHFWSLSTEEQFYLLTPVLLALLGPRRLAAYCCGVLVSAVVLAYLTRGGTGGFWLRLASSFAFHQIHIAVGSLVALLTFSGRLRVQLGQIACLALLVGSALVCSPYFQVPGAIKNPIAAGMMSLALVSIIQLRDGLLHRLLNSRPAVTLGVLSYSLYIWQQAFLHRPVLQVGVWENVALLLAVASASYWLYERPFLRLKERMFSGSTPSQSSDWRLALPYRNRR